MSFPVATLVLEGISPYSQSRLHDEPRLEGEGWDDYDRRTWRSKLTVEKRDGRDTVVIPAHGLHQCFAAAARYSKRQIPGQGKATWTAKFLSGISLPENPALNIDPASLECEAILANADGKRGSGKRVTRRFPKIPIHWKTAPFEVWVLDPIIIQDVFREMVDLGGTFIGIGRFRPENGGNYGRFRIASLAWADNRRLAA